MVWSAQSRLVGEGNAPNWRPALPGVFCSRKLGGALLERTAVLCCKQMLMHQTDGNLYCTLYRSVNS